MKKEDAVKRITLFYLETCPYCVKARRALEELRAEDPAFRDVEIDWVEESRQRRLADAYDYYYVPALFDGDRKLYEADPTQDYASIKESIRAALNAVL